MPLLLAAPVRAASLPPLGTAARFGVLAASTLTNTGLSHVVGDVGVSPGTAIVGFPPGTLTGVIHAGDAVAAQAQQDITVAYNNAAGQACTQNLTGQDLGGLTLVPGVYCFAAAAQLTGQLTLNGQGNPNSVFIFQIGSTLITASNARVLLIGGAQPCRIFWQVGSSATLGTTTDFSGNILALASVTLTTGATSNGGLYARTGAVTLDSNQVQSCAQPVAPTPTNTPPPPSTATGTPLPPASTATPLPPTSTPLPPTATTPVPPLPPTSTPVNTPVPPTNPPRPTPVPPTNPPVDTPVPPTALPVNTPVNTPGPGITETALPLITETALPLTTETALPGATETAIVIATITAQATETVLPGATETAIVIATITAQATETVQSASTATAIAVSTSTAIAVSTATALATTTITLATETTIPATTVTVLATPTVAVGITPTLGAGITPTPGGTVPTLPRTGELADWRNPALLLVTLLLVLGLAFRWRGVRRAR